jgi:hypothetical protein
MVKSKNSSKAVWRDILQQWEVRANSALVEAIGTEKTARVFNTIMNSGFQLQEEYIRATERYLGTLNLPSRSDIQRLSQRIDAIDYKVDLLINLLSSDGTTVEQNIGVGASRPARTRRSGHEENSDG